MNETRTTAILASCIATLAAAPTALLADAVTLGASKDNTLYETADGSLSNGAGSHLFTGRTAAPEIRRAVVAFDVAAAVPAGATIDAVTLRLNMSQGQAGTRSVALHRALANWGEGTSDAPANEGGGAPSTIGDATWVHTFYNVATWTAPGGDFAPDASAVQSIGGLGFHTWGSTPAMIADVQNWLDAPASNYGWILVGDESTNSTSRRFDSRQNPIDANRPALTIEFTPAPEPATLTLLGLGISLISRRRARTQAAR